MPEVPKIVHDRLRAGLPGDTAPEASHPDPDLLTAFAEQALSAAEREAVLQHLARCAGCRELVALSIPPLESGTQSVAPAEREFAVSVAGNIGEKAGEQRPWFAWAGLRWAALAAGIAVAGGILLIHPGKPNAVQEAKQRPANTAQPETIIAKEAVPAPAGTRNATNLEKKSAPAERAFRRDTESKHADSAAAPADKILARGQIEPRMADKDLTAAAAAGAGVGAAISGPAPASPVPASTETVQVTSESAAVTTQEAQIELPATAREVSGRNVSDLMAVSKAKAAKTESNEPSTLQRSEGPDKKQATTSQQQHAFADMNAKPANLRANANQSDSLQVAEHPAQWAIQSNDLQRSLDSGVAWKTVLHSDRPLLCYASGGNEIWVGGKGGDLFHSANGGITWNQVHPSAQQQTLSEDVTHIDIYGPSQIVLSTSKHQSWSTADGGKTWEKK